MVYLLKTVNIYRKIHIFNEPIGTTSLLIRCLDLNITVYSVLQRYNKVELSARVAQVVECEILRVDSLLPNLILLDCLSHRNLPPSITLSSRSWVTLIIEFKLKKLDKVYKKKKYSRALFNT